MLSAEIFTLNTPHMKSYDYWSFLIEYACMYNIYYILSCFSRNFEKTCALCSN